MENKNKEKKLDKVQKRSTYQEMKESNDKAKTFVIMLKNDPEMLNYFKEKNLFTRTGEIAHIILSTEKYSKKEHLRSPLYNLVEKYKGDNEFKYASAEKEIKKLVQDSITFIKNTNSNEYQAVLKVLENINKEEIDASKIYHDKEWYRQLIKTLGAMGIGAALMARAFWAVPETKPEQIVQIVENKIEVQVGDESCPSSLKMCLDSLEDCRTRKVTLKKIDCNEDEICKLYKDEIEELRKMLKDGEAGLLAKIDALNKALEEEKKKDRNVTLKLYLLKKLDTKFEVTDKEGVSSYYPKYRKLWENRLNKNDKSAFITLIMLGDYIMVPYIIDSKVEGLYGHGQKMPDGKIADIRESIRKGNYVYIAGVWYKNDRPGTTKAFMDVIEEIYNYNTVKYGSGNFEGKLE